jgi:hypothetical protein
VYCARSARSTHFAPPDFELRRFEQYLGFGASLQITSTSTTLDEEIDLEEATHRIRRTNKREEY